MLLRRFPAICLLLIAGLISPMPARAGLFEQLAVCPAASSLGSAVTAYPEGCGGLAVHFNPAHLATYEASRFDNALIFTINKREATYTQGIDPETGELWAYVASRLFMVNISALSKRLAS